MAAKLKSADKYTKNRHKHKPKNISKHHFEKVYWPYLPVVLFISLMLVFASQSNVWVAAMRHPVGKVLDYATSMSIDELLVSTNAQRSGGGVGLLTLNSKLNASAQAKANDMAARNYWSHYTPDGQAPWVFITDQGYTYQKLGENLAAGFADAQSTVDGWMGSPSHRENLLDPAFSDVGFGFINNPNYTSAGGGPMTIVVAHYGKPATVAAAPATTIKPRPATPVVKQDTVEQQTPTPATSLPATKPANTQVANSQSLTPQVEKTLPAKTSRAELILAKSSIAPAATGMVSLLFLAALALWVSKHLLMLRRNLLYSEAFIIKHPLIDVGLIIIISVSFILTQTAGLIK